MIKRVSIRLEESIYDKTRTIAEGYGVSINTLMTFVIGSYVSTASNLVDKLATELVIAAGQKNEVNKLEK